MRRLGLALVILVLAGCGGGSAKVSDKNLGSRVLQHRDLPRAFSSFYDGRQSKLDATSGYRSDLTRFGRTSGWIARFHRAGTRTTRGPLVVVSRLDLFGSAEGADQDLSAYAAEFDHQPGVARRTLQPPRIGDETIGTSFVQPGTAAAKVRFFTVAWRYRNASASVTVEGFSGRVTAADAITLARRQQRRIAAS
jgi:hypothetical protein